MLILELIRENNFVYSFCNFTTDSIKGMIKLRRFYFPRQGVDKILSLKIRHPDQGSGDNVIDEVFYHVFPDFSWIFQVFHEFVYCHYIVVIVNRIRVVQDLVHGSRELLFPVPEELINIRQTCWNKKKWIFRVVYPKSYQIRLRPVCLSVRLLQFYTFLIGHLNFYRLAYLSDLYN